MQTETDGNSIQLDKDDIFKLHDMFKHDLQNNILPKGVKSFNDYVDSVFDPPEERIDDDIPEGEDLTGDDEYDPIPWDDVADEPKSKPTTTPDSTNTLPIVKGKKPKGILLPNKKKSTTVKFPVVDKGDSTTVAFPAKEKTDTDATGFKLTRNCKHRQPRAEDTILKGSETAQAKLHERDIPEIRKRAESGEEKLREIAADYGVIPDTICKVKHRKTWKHVKDAA